MGKKLFDYVIGNPPYQEDTNDTSDKPVYNYMLDAAYKISERAEFITPARFLFNAGKTPKQWNQKMLNDSHLTVMFYEQQSEKIFPNTDIKGGVVITYRDTNKNYGEIGTFTACSELNEILKRVTHTADFESIEGIVYVQNKFDLYTLYLDHPEFINIIGSSGKEKRLTTAIFSQLSVFSDERTKPTDLKILGLIENKRHYRYIDPKYITPHENLNKYKVIVPKSNGTGAIGEVLSTPLIGEPLIGYTQSFISIGAFNTKTEAEALFKYIKSKFARTMLGILKVTQDNNKGVWQYVPLQDFTSASDIDWSKSIHEIDLQLYRKYGLDEKEIEFIESHVKEMA